MIFKKCKALFGFFIDLCHVNYVGQSTLYDAIHFEGAGVYRNPLTVQPSLLKVDRDRVVFADPPLRGMPVVYTLPVVVSECDLTEATSVHSNGGGSSSHKRLIGWPFDDYMDIFAAHFGTVFARDKLFAYRQQGSLQFASLPDSASVYSMYIICFSFSLLYSILYSLVPCSFKNPTQGQRVRICRWW